MLRCWDPADAPLFADAVSASVDELRPWMAWAAREPTSLADRVTLLRRFRAQFDLDEDWVYGILDRDEAVVVGGTGLHPRVGAAALEIGYWIRSDRTRRGLATETAGALTRIAFEVVGVDRVEIRVDSANTGSRVVPERLGYAEEATLRRRLDYPERRDVVIYTLFGDAYPATPAARAEVEAFDVLGTRVL